MNIIPQMKLFEESEFENLGDLERLQTVLGVIDDAALIRKLYRIRGKGRNDWPCEAMWNSFIASFLFEHDTVENLLRELRRNKQLRAVCGFEPKTVKQKDGSVKVYVAPSASAYSNFLKNLIFCQEELDKMFEGMASYMYEKLEHFGEILMVDGKAVQSFGTKKSRKRKSGRRGEYDADWCKKQYSAGGPNGETVIKTKKWFGFRLHLIADAAYEIPVAFSVTNGFNPDNVYDTLDFIHANRDRIIRRINTNLVKKAHRSPEIIYYGVTNFYFEIGEPDEDVLDEEGNVIEKGLRKMGVCKEERKLPIVRMGLFMDDAGIPVAIETFPGNTLDHLTLKKSLENSIDGMDFSRFILIADRGICNYPNLLHVSDAGNGYIVSKSLLKSTKKEQEWACSDEDYISVSGDFKYKSRIVKKTVKDENGNKRTLEEKVVVYWSRKFQARAERENKKFLDFLHKLKEHPENFRITAVQSKSLRKFFKKECVNEQTGEILDSSKIRAFVDFDKVAEYKKSLGYYQIVTSELTMDAREVIDKYHGLTQIEDQFRVMKGDLETRPFYVNTPEHIAAHLLVCMIALIMMRVIQKKIRDSGRVPVDPDAYWSSGLNAGRIQEALNQWKVDLMPGDLYRFMDVDDPDLELILDAFGIHIPAKLYRRAELKRIKTEIKIFT